MTPSDVLLADVFHALAGEPHPLRPTPGATSPEQAKSNHEQLAARLRAQRERLARPKEDPPNV